MNTAKNKILKLVDRYATAQRSIERAQQRDAGERALRILDESADEHRDRVEQEIDALIATMGGVA